MESSKNRGRSTPASASNSGTRRASSFPCRLHLGCPRMSHFRLRSNRLELAQRTRRLVRSDSSHFASTVGSMCITIPVDPSAAIHGLPIVPANARALRENQVQFGQIDHFEQFIPKATCLTPTVPPTSPTSGSRLSCPSSIASRVLLTTSGA